MSTYASILAGSYLFIFKERGREEEGEKHRSVVSCMSLTRNLAHNPGMCLTGNRTSDLSVCRMMPNPLSHTTQGYFFFLKILFIHFF